MSVSPFSDGIFVQIRSYTFNHLDLLACLIEGDSVRVASAEENFENFKRIAIESIATDLAFSVYRKTGIKLVGEKQTSTGLTEISVFKCFFTVAVVSFS